MKSRDTRENNQRGQIIRSRRKPHNQDAGYVAEKIFNGSGSHIVIYHAEAQGIDVDGRYAIVCSKHHTFARTTNIPDARVLMKYPEFCEACMDEELASIKNPRFRHAVRLSRQSSPVPTGIET